MNEADQEILDEVVDNWVADQEWIAKQYKDGSWHVRQVGCDGMMPDINTVMTPTTARLLAAAPKLLKACLAVVEASYTSPKPVAYKLCQEAVWAARGIRG